VKCGSWKSSEIGKHYLLGGSATAGGVFGVSNSCRVTSEAIPFSYGVLYA